MNAIITISALTVGIFALTTNNTAISNSSSQTQQPQKLSQASNAQKVATVKIDGSSTVYPITRAIAKDYQSNTKNSVQPTVTISGTTGGFEKFCTGKTDINNASRPISK